MAALRQLLLFAAIAAAGAAVLTGLHLATANRSAHNVQQAADRLLLQAIAVPEADRASLLPGPQTADTTLLGLRAPQHIVLVRRDGATIAVIVPLVAREGYGGDIQLLAGITADGRITGVHVLAQRETPGLGAAIADSNWLDGFTGTSLLDPAVAQWLPKNQGGAFDAITGATMTSRAVIKAVRQALEYFAVHRAELLEDSHHE